jgi:organic hydroperoxide reductase OsmC/OhrA
MLVPFPHHYSASLSRTFASRARVEAPSRPTLCGSPSQDAEASAWSPERMLLSSLGTCMLTTFEVFAARDGIEVLSWDAKVSGTVEHTPEGRMFTSIVMELELHLDGCVDHLEETLEDAKQYCLVLNTMRVPVVIETQIHTPNDVPDELPLPHGMRPPARDMYEQRHAS